MTLSRESLRKMSMSQLEGKLAEVKAKYSEASTNLTMAKEAQILKTKVIRGKGNKRKREMISQILKINKETQKINTKIKQISLGNEIKFTKIKVAARKKVALRAKELRETGAYKTSMTNEEKVYAWCYDMDVSQEELDILLEMYTMEDLAMMSGDDFYDEVKKSRQEYYQRTHELDEDEEELTMDSVFI